MFRAFILLPGPIADPLVRKAYIAAYDRRLRHAAWVCYLRRKNVPNVLLNHKLDG